MDFLHSFLDSLCLGPSFCCTCLFTKVARLEDGARDLKSKANFWHWVWLEAGSPPAGVFTELKTKVKSHYKYKVRRLKRRAQFVMRKKLLLLFLHGTGRISGRRLNGFVKSHAQPRIQ